MIPGAGPFFVALLLCLATAGSVRVWAATQEALDDIQSIRMELNQIDRLIDAVNGMREWNRDGLNTRID